MKLLSYSDYTTEGIYSNMQNLSTVIAGIVLLIGIVYIVKKLKELWR